MGEVIKGPWRDKPKQSKEGVVDKLGHSHSDSSYLGEMFSHVDPEMVSWYEHVYKRLQTFLQEVSKRDTREFREANTNLKNVIQQIEDVYSDYQFPDDNVLSDFNIVKYVNETPEDALKRLLQDAERFLNKNEHSSS